MDFSKEYINKYFNILKKKVYKPELEIEKIEENTSKASEHPEKEENSKMNLNNDLIIAENNGQVEILKEIKDDKIKNDEEYQR